MSTDCSVIPTETISCNSAPSSAPGSPRNRVKFLCSHGGKILPRPADAHLKYVGGETRVISVPRDIPFQELMKKLTYLVDGEMILKYQMVTEDLDALVSVKNDEDLRHMFDEVDHYEIVGAPRLRAFLFPATPVVMENQTGALDPHALQQRYIDAINGIIRSGIKQHPTINVMQLGSLVSSAGSSPRSPDSCTTEAMNNDSHHQHNCLQHGMHKVHSLPSICSLNVPQQGGHYVHQPPPHYYHRQPHLPGFQSPKPPVDPHKSMGPERLISVRSVGRAEGVRYQVDPTPHYYTSRQSRGSGTCGKCMHHDDSSHYMERRMMDRTGSLAMSPVPSSPRQGHTGMRAWDGTIGGDI